MIPMLISSLLVLFFFGFNGDNFLGTDRVEHGTLSRIERASKAICGVLMIGGVTYGASSYLEGQTDTIQPGQNSTDSVSASNGKCLVHAHDSITSQILEDPASTFFTYSTTQTPTPYVNFDAPPLEHTPPNAKTVEPPDAFQDMINFVVIVGLISLCILVPVKILQFLFDRIWPPAQTQNAARSRSDNAVNLEPYMLETIRSAITSNNLTQSQATGRLSARMDNMEERIGGRFQESDTEVQRSFGEIRRLLEAFTGRYAKDQIENNTISDAVKTRLDESDDNIQALLKTIEELRDNDKNDKTNAMDAKIERLIKVVDSQKDKIHHLNETVERLSSDKIVVLEGEIENVMKSIKAINPADQLKLLDAKLDYLYKLVKATNSEPRLKALAGSMDLLRNITSKALTVDGEHFQALNNRISEILAQVSVPSLALVDLKDLTQQLAQRVALLEKEVARANDKIEDHHYLEMKIEEAQREIQKDISTMTARASDVRAVRDKLKEELGTVKNIPGQVQDLQKEMTKISNLGDNFQSMTEQFKQLQVEMQTELHKIKGVPGKVQELQKDILKISNLGFEVQSMTEKFNDMKGELQTELQKIKGIPGKFQELHKSISAISSNNAADIRSMKEQFKEMREELQFIKATPERIEDLNRKFQEVQDLVRRKHDSIVSRLEANPEKSTSQIITPKMQEGAQASQDIPNQVQYMNKEIKEAQNDLKQKYDSILSQLEANRCNCQHDTPVMAQGDKDNDSAGKFQDLNQEFEDLREEVQQKHDSVVSKLETDLRKFDDRLTSQETREEEMKKAHDDRLDRHEESLNRHENSLSMHESSLSGLREDIIKIEPANNDKGPTATSGATTDPESLKALIQQLAEEIIQLQILTSRDELKTELQAELTEKFKELDLHLWKDRLSYQVQKLEENVEESKCACTAGDLADKVGKLEEGIEAFKCKCSADDHGKDKAGDLEEIIRKHLAESCSEWKQKVEDEMTSLASNLDFYEGARAENGVKITEVDERLQGIEHQVQNAKEYWGKACIKRINASFPEGQEREKRLKTIENRLKTNWFAWMIETLWDRIWLNHQKLTALAKNLQNDGSIKTDPKVLEELQTLQVEYMALWNIYNLPGVQQAVEQHNQATSQTEAWNLPTIPPTEIATDQMEVEPQTVTIQPEDLQSAPPHQMEVEPQIMTVQPENLQTAPAQQGITTTNENFVQQNTAPVQTNNPGVPQSNPIYQQPLNNRVEADLDEFAAEMEKALEEHTMSIEERVLTYLPQFQPTPLPNQPDTSMNPQSSSNSQPIFRYQPEDPDEIPPELRAILAHGPPRQDSSMSYTSQSNQPNPPMQNVPLPQFSPVSNQGSFTERQALPGTTPYGETPQDASEEQPSEDKPVDLSSRKIKKPMSRRKSYQKQQQQKSQQTSPQFPTTEFNFVPQQPQQQQQQQQENLASTSEPTQPPLRMEDIINEKQLEDTTMTEAPNQGDTIPPPLSPPPSPPRMGPEAYSKLEQGATERAQAQRTYDDLFEEPPESPDRDVAMDDEERKVEERRKEEEEAKKRKEEEKKKKEAERRGRVNRPLSLPGMPPAPSVPAKTQTDTSKATAQGSVEKRQEISTAPQGESSGVVKDSGENKKEGQTVKQQTPAPKHADNAQQAKAASSAVKTSSDARKDPWTTNYRLVQPEPLPLPSPKQSTSQTQSATKQKGPTSQVQMSGSQQKTSGEQGKTSQATGNSSQSQGIAASDSRPADKQDDNTPKEELVSGPAQEDDRQARHQAIIDAFADIKGKSLHESRWADQPEQKEESSKEEKTLDADTKGSSTLAEESSGVKSLETSERPKDKAPSKSSASTSAEELDDRERRHQAVIEVFSQYQGTPLSESRWADKPDEQKDTASTQDDEAKTSMAEKSAVQTVEEAFSKVKDEKSADDNLPATPVEGGKIPAKSEGESSAAATVDTREEEFQAFKEAWGNVKGRPLTESRWAVKDDEEKTVSTPVTKAESSPSGGLGGKCGSKARGKGAKGRGGGRK